MSPSGVIVVAAVIVLIAVFVIYRKKHGAAAVRDEVQSLAAEIRGHLNTIVNLKAPALASAAPSTATPLPSASAEGGATLVAATPEPVVVATKMSAAPPPDEKAKAMDSVVPRLPADKVRAMWQITVLRHTPESDALMAELGPRLSEYIKAYGAQSGGGYYYDGTLQGWALSDDASLDEMASKFASPLLWATKRRPAVLNSIAAGKFPATWTDAYNFVGYKFKAS